LTEFFKVSLEGADMQNLKKLNLCRSCPGAMVSFTNFASLVKSKLNIFAQI
jgi:hypothetical protein